MKGSFRPWGRLLSARDYLSVATDEIVLDQLDQLGGQNSFI